MGGAGQAQPYWRRILTKFSGGGKARAGKNSFPPTPFLFARPSFKNSSKFRIWIFFEKSSDFVQRSEPHRMFVADSLGASRRKWQIIQNFPRIFCD